MAQNTFVNPQMITWESLAVLTNTCRGVRSIDKSHEKYFMDEVKIGSSLNVRKPPRFIGRIGSQFTPEGLTDTFAPLTINNQFGVDFEFSDAERSLNIDDMKRRYLRPAMIAIANYVNTQAYVMMYQTCPNVLGTVGTIPSTGALATYSDARAFLTALACPEDRRGLLLNSKMGSKATQNQSTLFNPQKQVSAMYEDGYMGTYAGFEFAEDEGIRTHTVGTYAGTPLVNGANQTGSALITDGWTSGAATLNLGDAFTIGSGATGVYSVNPQTRQTTGNFQYFAVTAQTSDVTGAMTIPIFPAIVPSGQFQNVTASPADNAAINVVGTTGASGPQAIGLNPIAYTQAFIPLSIPKGVDDAYAEPDPQTGIKLRFVRDWDPVRGMYVARFDVLWGWAPMYSDSCAVRITG